jgi:putative transcriptional regulator
MSATHHPSEAMLAAYAAGALPETQALAIATHGAFCPACRAWVGRIEALGGLVLSEAEPLAMGAGAAARALEKLHAEPAAPPSKMAVSDVPRPLADYLPGGIAKAPWRALLRGVALCPVMRRDAGQAFLIRVRPGVGLPRHRHEGTELTLVLAGSFSDEDGRFARGDVEERDDAASHGPVAGDEGDCVCLVAIDGRLRLDGLLSRLVRPLLGI